MKISATPTTFACLCFSIASQAAELDRNHHVYNMGAIIETGTAFPGNNGQIPQDVAPLAEMLRLAGFATAAFGKWHENAAWEASMAGPFDRWPTRQGFDKFDGGWDAMREQILARTIHLAPWEPRARRAIDDNSAWELFDTTRDFAPVNIKNRSKTVTADVGIDLATPVVEAIGSGRNSKFTGNIRSLSVDVR
jgi:arylsulfatase A-like enzyme